MPFRFLPVCRLHYWMLFFLLISAGLANAQDVQPQIQKEVTPAWVKPFDYESGNSPDEKDIDGGEYLELLDQQYNLEKEAVYCKVIRHITSEAGVQNSAQISISFAPSYQKLIFHDIKIIRDGKVIDQMDISKIKLIRNETELERYIYSGLYTAYMNLEDVRVGDKVEYAYTLSGMNPILDHQFGNMFYFNAQTPISHLFIRLIAPAGQRLNLKYFNQAPHAELSTINNEKVYEWKLSNCPPYVAESGEPSWYYGAPYVQVSSSPNWKDIANWGVKNLNSVKIKNDAQIQSLVSDWSKTAGDSDLYYARLATRFVQDQVRYMGVEMGSYSHLPHNPDQVLKQRFGDCKDKSLLLCTFLQLHHMDASVAFVNAYYGDHLNHYLPSVDLFDHAIVTFNFKGRTYWIDPTISYQRGNIITMATPDYGYALVVRPGEDSLTRMVVNDAGRTEILERFILPAKIKENAILSVSTTYTGAAADDIRQQFKMNSFSTIQKSYLDYYHQLYNHVSIIDSIRFADEPEQNKIIIKEKYAIGKPWLTVDSVHQIKKFIVYAKALQDRLPASPDDDRKSPLALMAPVNLTYSIQLIPPGNWNIQPNEEIISHKPYYYSFASSKSGDTINLDYIYQTYQNYIASDSMKMINTDLQTINADLSYGLTQNESLMQSKNRMSWISVWITLFSLALFSWLAVRMYRYSPQRLDKKISEGLPIGGWLILVCIGLCLTPIRLIYSMIVGGYYNQSLWLRLQAYSQPSLTFLVALELIANIFLICASVYILVLFFRRRDTLPATFIVVYSFNIVFIVVDHFLSKSILGSPGGTMPAAFSQLILYSIIWIPYFLISKRVKETFIYSYGQKAAVILPDKTYSTPVEPRLSDDYNELRDDALEP